MAEVVVPMPSSLDRLAEQIRTDLSRRDQSREAWIVSTLDLCQHLAEARAEFSADIDFGHWYDAQGFGLNPNDRAAAIEMGRHLAEARRVLERTERRSLRLIHDHEFRYSSDAIPATAPTPPKAVKAPKPPSRSKEDIRERIVVRLLAGHKPWLVACDINNDLPKKERIDETVVIKVRTELRADGKLPDPAKEKRDRLRAEFRAEIEAEMETEIRRHVVERGAKYRQAMEQREQEAAEAKRFYETLVNRHKPPLTTDEFMLLHLCVRGDASEDKRHRAGVLLNEKRTVLTDEK